MLQRLTDVFAALLVRLHSADLRTPTSQVPYDKHDGPVDKMSTDSITVVHTGHANALFTSKQSLTLSKTQACNHLGTFEMCSGNCSQMWIVRLAVMLRYK